MMRPTLGATCAALATACLWSAVTLASPGQQQAAATRPPVDIPYAAGVTFVLAVHNANAGPAGDRIATGDYEMVVALAEATAEHHTLAMQMEGEDDRKQPLRLNIQRRVPAGDLRDARLQILGFHGKDGPTLPGTTALGPSLAIMRDLRTTGRAAFSLRNFHHMGTARGTLERDGQSVDPFPVLLNGKRVDLPAWHVTGKLTHDRGVIPVEFRLLDHPQHPLTLRFVMGATGTGFPIATGVTREIVRIDVPALASRVVEEALTRECRAEVPGVYFDFNQATINPQSQPALRDAAALLRRQSGWTVTIEGHTDDVGSDAYNQDLSARRAAAVKAALVADGVGASRLTTAGFGEQRPRESNETIAGRARNRRVELVRECPGTR